MSKFVSGWQNKSTRIAITSVFLFSLSFSFLIPFGIATDSPNISPMAAGDMNELSTKWQFARGMPGAGATMQPKLVNLTSDGKLYVITGNDQGLGILNSEGIVKASFLTPGPVIDFEVIGDVSGDGQKDIVLVCLYQQSANVFCIDSSNGNEIWSFDATILGFDQTNFIPKNFTTNTWDCCIVNDINADGFSEVAVASWYRVFLVNGKTGAKLWEVSDKVDLSDDVWRIETITDVNSNSYEEIVAGSEAGEIVLLDSKTSAKVYSTAIPKRTIWTYGSTPAGVQKAIVISVTDLKIIADQNNDATPEILVGGNDGVVRMLSGKTGVTLNTVTVHAVSIPTLPISSQDNGELYQYEARLFQKKGLKFITCPDVNNDGIEDVATYSNGLELSQNGPQLPLQLKVVAINASGLSVIAAANFSYETFRYLPYPVVQKIGSQCRIYFYSSANMNNIQKGIFYYLIQAKMSQTPIYPLQSWDSSYFQYQYDSYIGTYMCSGTDKSGDGVPDLFVFSTSGEYSLIDAIDGTTIWKRSKKTSQASVKQIQDLTGDGIKDLLFTSEIEFSPEWKGSSQSGQQYKSSETTNIITEIAAINAVDGTVIWSYDSPSSVYEGIRDLIEIGDIDGDSFTDYAGWIIPSYLPSEIKAYLRILTGSDSISSVQGSGDWQTDYIGMVYRSLLVNYTRFITINGSSGKIMINRPLIEMPYNFVRDSGSNSYYYNRINGRADNSWFSDPSSWDSYNYNNNWLTESMLHSNTINLEVSDDSKGNAFDLWGNQGSNYNITKYNGNASLITGLTQNLTAIGTQTPNDQVYWFVNSTKVTTEDKIIIENSYSLTDVIHSPIQNLSVGYMGVVSVQPYSIGISAWNFNSLSWIPISNSQMNVTSSARIEYFLPSVSDFCGPNNLTKIRLEASDPIKNFSLNLDELTMKYIFKFQNMSISADKVGSQYSILMNMSYFVNFSSDAMLDSLGFPLSQLQRASALKIQSDLTVNESLYYDYFNYTYALYNYTSNQWIDCNWSSIDTFWSTGSAQYPDLYGEYASTRTNSKYFQFDASQYKTDSMYLQTRGSFDEDPSTIELDYLNASTISDFINPSNKEIKLRINITNPMRDFNVTFNTLGIQAFYWDIAPMRYDPKYIYDYKYGMGGSPSFTTSQLKNLEVQDIALINGTGDQYLDVVVVLGYMKIYTSSGSTNLRLFDVKHDQVYSIWNNDLISVPKDGVKISTYNLKGNNQWIISGQFYNDSQYIQLTALINDTNCKWNSGYTYFKPYSNSNSYLNYTRTINLTTSSSYGNKYYYPGIINYKTTGNNLAIEMIEKPDSGSPTNLILYAIENLTVVGKVPITGLYQDTSGSSSNSFKMIELGPDQQFNAFLDVATDDFDGDGVLDSIGYYQEAELKYLRVYSGVISEAEPTKLKEVQFTYSNMYGGQSQSTELNFISVGDLDGDGGAEIAYGEQTYNSGWSSASKGASISFLNVKSNANTEWVLEKWVSPPWDSQISKSFVDAIKQVGDINGDGYSEVLVTHNVYFETQSYGSYSNYEAESVTEIVDVKNHKMLMRFGTTVNSLIQCSDITGDQINDYVITAGEIVYCLNSAFKVRLTNLYNWQIMDTNGFNIEWTSNSTSGVVYELIIEGSRYGYTTATSAQVSLGAGEKLIQIFLRDSKGVVIAIDSVTITIPANNTMMLFTFGMVVGLVVITLIYKGIKKKSAQKVLVDLM